MNQVLINWMIPVAKITFALMMPSLAEHATKLLPKRRNRLKGIETYGMISILITVDTSAAKQQDQPA
ncbi:hypothetical protein M3I54_04240 [Paraburkholderia sp. CNPSo 3274]|uniref:hypothetical protein n=1 Tax=Paraburkholderia sp. CNPSo 3274 TaxID=2940932 RepID=UPI0020B6D5CF|nr:hypothetical protein [Paraburkholderia sp. CNPSo 3274]MCP3706201.1 hypothetical protein [Paraburkholderia sp. CNPSo 3274]